MNVTWGAVEVDLEKDGESGRGEGGGRDETVSQVRVEHRIIIRQRRFPLQSVECGEKSRSGSIFEERKI